MSVDVSWADDFVKSISEYVYVRERDSLLILLPNQAYKLNPAGLAILGRMMAGSSLIDVLEQKSEGLSKDEKVLTDVFHFFCDLRALVMGCLGEGKGRRAVEETSFTRPHNSLPVLSEIALTYRCNLSCKFCYAGCTCTKSDRNFSSEMSTAEVKQVLDAIRYDAEVPSVSWTGGEPTLRSDLVELTAYATELGMRVNLITNGNNLTQELVDQLKNAGLRSAQVSLEGANAEIHDSLTQTPGSYDRTLRGISLLKDAGLHVHTNTTINRINAPHLAEIVGLVKELGLKRLSMNMVIPCGTAPDTGVTVLYSEMPELLDKLKRAAWEADVEFLWYSPTPYCIVNPVAMGLGGKSCAACDGLLSIAPDGGVLPCSSLSKNVGNILKDGFQRVWNNRKSRYWRGKRYAHRICRDCRHFDICTGACPIYWDAIGYKEIESAVAVAARS